MLATLQINSCLAENLLPETLVLVPDWSATEFLSYLCASLSYQVCFAPSSPHCTCCVESIISLPHSCYQFLQLSSRCHPFGPWEVWPQTQFTTPQLGMDLGEKAKIEVFGKCIFEGPIWSNKFEPYKGSSWFKVSWRFLDVPFCMFTNVSSFNLKLGAHAHHHDPNMLASLRVKSPWVASWKSWSSIPQQPTYKYFANHIVFNLKNNLILALTGFYKMSEFPTHLVPSPTAGLTSIFWGRQISIVCTKCLDEIHGYNRNIEQVEIHLKDMLTYSLA